VTHHQREAIALGDRMAVLHEGKVLQTGPAQEIFRRPRSAFVARFVRTVNVLAGAVVGDAAAPRFRCEGGVVLDIASGVPTGPAHLCVRPEEVRLLAEAGSAPNHVPVTVLSLRDQGSTLHVQLAGAPALEALVTHREARELGLRAGQTLWAQLPRDVLHVIPAADA
jgi:ABC-type Fe3+/spermidine/putrescine transport system ATPase subunit